MDNEFELLDSKNEPIEELSDEDDLDVVKEKYKKLTEKHKDVFGKNRQLFERTKKAEGELKELKVEKPKAKDDKSDDKLLERLDKMALSVAGITASDEVELFNKWKEQTGREADDVVGNKIFQAELADLRTAKANLKATSDLKGEHGESGVKNTPDYWIAKATKGPDGNLLFSDETPKELYSKILEKLAENEPGNSEKLKFYNSK